MSYDSRPALGISRTPYGARSILHEFSRDFYTYIKITNIKLATIPSKKLIVKIRKIEADSDSDGKENHTCSSLQKINNTCLLHVNYP